MIAQEIIKRIETNSIDYLLTKFLTQEEITELKQIKNTNLNVFSFGGTKAQERERLIIQNKEYSEPSKEDYEISVLKISLPKKDLSITHRNVLGYLLSLGIKREVLGDILIVENNYYIYVTKDIVNYLKSNITRINQYFVNVEEIADDSFNYELKIESKEINISSNRIDAIISKVYNLSRESSQLLINKGLVQINHKQELHLEKSLKDNDLISVRGYGRFKFIGIIRQTKKERFVAIVEIFK